MRREPRGASPGRAGVGPVLPDVGEGRSWQRRGRPWARP